MPDTIETIARALFPDDHHDGTDCRADVGNEGAACRHCAYRREEWLKRVASVKAAIEAAPAPANPVRDEMLAVLKRLWHEVDLRDAAFDVARVIAKVEGRAGIRFDGDTDITKCAPINIAPAPADPVRDAADEMLAALKEAVAWVERVGCADEDPPQYLAMLRAIAKAEGRPHG